MVLCVLLVFISSCILMVHVDYTMCLLEGEGKLVHGWIGYDEQEQNEGIVVQILVSRRLK